MSKIKNGFRFVLATVFLFVSFSCKTTRSLDYSEFTPEAPYHIEEDVSPASDESFDETGDFSKCIFIRLYNPDYNNPFYIANILKGGINLTEISEYNFSHASINFDLEDDFYGLTSTGYYQLAQESCLHPEDNKYMKHCNPETSEQITLVLRVSEEEYENTKKMVEEYTTNHKLKYNVGLNFKNATFAIRRKFFTKKEKQEFGKTRYPKNRIKEKKELDPNYRETQMICSSFVAYVLKKNVAYIDDFFTENKINYRYINVTDILSFPNIQPLFYSTWENYELAANAFIEQNPEFSVYLE